MAVLVKGNRVSNEVMISNPYVINIILRVYNVIRIVARILSCVNTNGEIHGITSYHIVMEEFHRCKEQIMGLWTNLSLEITLLLLTYNVATCHYEYDVIYTHPRNSDIHILSEI
jgi:hypothetical protein